MGHTYISFDLRSTTYTDVVDSKMSVKEIKGVDEDAVPCTHRHHIDRVPGPLFGDHDISLGRTRHNGESHFKIFVLCFQRIRPSAGVRPHYCWERERERGRSLIPRLFGGDSEADRHTHSTCNRIFCWSDTVGVLGVCGTRHIPHRTNRW